MRRFWKMYLENVLYRKCAASISSDKTKLTCALPRDEAQDSMKAMDEGYIIVLPSMRHSNPNRDQLLFSFSPPLFHLSVTPKPTESKCKLNPKDQIPLPFPPSNPRFEAKTDLDLDLSCRFEITGSLIY
ncbi:hypothetical protein ACMD2_16534 [Ananas comosus]|uniref:Uncharacterized protein n=1 Tax=Ananas comosus TaxID=4615 RepID=A0A199VWX0_ANACO|nr:hypothetical protein ACMD2_16534 [Ananas comosus]